MKREMLMVPEVDKESEVGALEKEVDFCAVLSKLAMTILHRHYVQLNELDVSAAASAAQGNECSKKTAFRLFRVLDMNTNGSVDVDELLSFFFTFQRQEWSFEAVLDLAVAKMLCVNHNIYRQVKSRQGQNLTELVICKIL